MADKKRGLGRGLGALISSSPSAAVPEEKQDVSRETKPIESAAEASKTRATRPVDMFFEPGRKSSAPKAPVAPSKPTKRARATMPGLSTTLGSKSATVQHDDLQTEKQAIEKADSQEVAATSPELVEVPGAQFAELDVTLIHPNRKQPRSNFDQEHMDELIHSIREIEIGRASCRERV